MSNPGIHLWLPHQPVLYSVVIILFQCRGIKCLFVCVNKSFMFNNKGLQTRQCHQKQHKVKHFAHHETSKGFKHKRDLFFKCCLFRCLKYYLVCVHMPAYLVPVVNVRKDHIDTHSFLLFWASCCVQTNTQHRNAGQQGFSKYIYSSHCS